MIEASRAAAAAAASLATARFTLTSRREYPAERDVSQDETRIGVFVCSCGSNIGGFVDVPGVTQFAGDPPMVAHSECNLYTCSQDSIRHITEQVKEHNLNRVVVASCTPLTHQPLFQDSIRAAGLNPYLFEMANIRNQCSWVHSKDKATATSKAKELVHMAVARAALLQPQHTFELPVQRSALVIGGGAAGMSAALTIFHRSGNVQLERVAQSLSDRQFLHFAARAVTQSKFRDRRAVEHRTIVRAIIKGDADAAEEAWRDHLVQSETEAVEHLRQLMPGMAARPESGRRHIRRHQSLPVLGRGSFAS